MRITSSRPDKIVNQSKLIEETATRLDYYPKDVKKVLDTYMDVITDHIFDIDEYNKILSIRMFPSLQLFIKAVPSEKRPYGVTNLNTDSDIVNERLICDVRIGDRFRLTINSIFRAKHNLFDSWFRQFEKEKRKKELAIWQRQQNKVKYGEAEYSDTSITDLDIAHAVQPKRTFGERLKRNKKKKKNTKKG